MLESISLSIQSISMVRVWRIVRSCSKHLRFQRASCSRRRLDFGIHNLGNGRVALLGHFHDGLLQFGNLRVSLCQ